jgi:predicted trehalose synthase
VTETTVGAPAPAFVAALDAVPHDAWSKWMAEQPSSAEPATERRLAATFAIPPCHGLAAICLLETRSRAEPSVLHQVALRLWFGEAPAGARVLHQSLEPDGSISSTLASVWSDPGACLWLRAALASGASLRSEGWEWHATPERPAVTGATDGSARPIPGRRHDVILLEPSAVAVVYRRIARGSQAEVDLLRHLERVAGARVAPMLLGFACVRAPDGTLSASAILEDIDADAATVRSVIVGRLRRALDGDPSLQASALDDVRAVGVLTRQLHAALGRPFDEGVLVGAIPAAQADVRAWVVRARDALERATLALRAARTSDAALRLALDALPLKLPHFADAAEAAPGIVHRIHGNLTLDTILVSPPRNLSIVEFDGDASLPESERAAPQSPLRDVARLLVSLAEAAADAARAAGGDASAFEIAWLWEREARTACLEGYGSGGGALHALLAIFETEFAARILLDAVAQGVATAVASHILERLTRTVV